MTRADWTHDEMQQIAQRDPCLAMSLLVYGGQRQIYSVQATFTSGGIGGEALPGTFMNPTSSHFMIYDFDYTVEMPSFAAGNIGRATAQKDNALIPNIDAQIFISAGMSGGLGYYVNLDFQAVNTLARCTNAPDSRSPCSWTSGWLLPWGSQMTIKHLLTRAYTGGELPVKITWSLHTAFLGATFFDVKEDEAIAYLGELGYKVPANRPAIRRRRPGIM